MSLLEEVEKVTSSTHSTHCGVLAMHDSCQEFYAGNKENGFVDLFCDCLCHKVVVEDIWENNPTDDGKPRWTVEVITGIFAQSYNATFIGTKPTKEGVINHFRVHRDSKIWQKG